MFSSNLNNEACITISNQPAEESLELPLQALNLKQEAKENEYEESPKLKDEVIAEHNYIKSFYHNYVNQEEK